MKGKESIKMFYTGNWYQWSVDFMQLLNITISFPSLFNDNNSSPYFEYIFRFEIDQFDLNENSIYCYYHLE